MSKGRARVTEVIPTTLAEFLNGHIDAILAEWERLHTRCIRRRNR